MLLGPSCPQYPLLMSDIINGLQHYFLLSSESFSWLLKNCLWLMGIDPGGTVFSLSPDIQTNYPSHAFGGPLQSCLCSLSVSSSPCDQQVLEKVASGGPELAPLWVSAAGREVQTHQPLPRSLRKGPAFWHLRALGGDRKEGETLTSCREPQPAQTFAGWRVTPGAGCCGPPRSPLGRALPSGFPGRRTCTLSSRLRHSLLGYGSLSLSSLPAVPEACSAVPFSAEICCGDGTMRYVPGASTSVSGTLFLPAIMYWKIRKISKNFKNKNSTKVSHS